MVYFPLVKSKASNSWILTDGGNVVALEDSFLPASTQRLTPVWFWNLREISAFGSKVGNVSGMAANVSSLCMVNI
ncbi:hypothetical protein WICPIJ_000187 [Wickerhamomyces pijperi]|uniref:Uncharacterized protein n=1 Tax=Wickerhamomyces pijperi TaxID=599730 RepID=A0A9P8QHA6_WICPI|nr:hypothetical protein WICPIJ_000187 [Wickerhamomyces pijperi]